MGTTLNNVRSEFRGYGHLDARHEGASPQIAVRFDPLTLKRLRVRAAKNGLPVARIIRQLVDDALSRS